MRREKKYSTIGWSLLGATVLVSIIARVTLGPKPDLPLSWTLVNVATEIVALYAFLYFGKSDGLRLAKKLDA